MGKKKEMKRVKRGEKGGPKKGKERREAKLPIHISGLHTTKLASLALRHSLSHQPSRLPPSHPFHQLIQATESRHRGGIS